MFTTSPKTSRCIARAVSKEWSQINARALDNAVKKLYQSKLVGEKYHADGSTSVILTEHGKQRALRYSLENMHIKKPVRWDKKWRMALFDMPESQKKMRDAFRGHLKKLGFYEFQKSVFVYPYECKNELDFLIEFYNGRKYIRFITVESLDNELDLKRHFHL